MYVGVEGESESLNEGIQTVTTKYSTVCPDLVARRRDLMNAPRWNVLDFHLSRMQETACHVFHRVSSPEQSDEGPLCPRPAAVMSDHSPDRSRNVDNCRGPF